MTFTRATYTYVPVRPREKAPPAPQRGSRLRERVAPPEKPFNWYESARCKGQGNVYGNVWMYPDKHESGVVEAAKRVCAVCPVKAHCAADAREDAPTIGIRAGKVYGAAPAKDTRMTRVCVVCGSEFKGFGPAATCSSACRRAHHKERGAFYARQKRAARAAMKDMARNGPDPEQVWGTMGEIGEPGVRQHPGSDRKPLEGPR